jgi:hypothetical protein
MDFDECLMHDGFDQNRFAGIGFKVKLIVFDSQRKDHVAAPETYDAAVVNHIGVTETVSAEVFLHDPDDKVTYDF